jgi:hypothetical protein
LNPTAAGGRLLINALRAHLAELGIVAAKGDKEKP